MSLICSYCPFSIPGSHPRSHITFSCHVPWGSWAVSVLDPPCFQWPVQFGGGLVSCGMLVCRDLSSVFLSGLCVLGRKSPEVKCHFHHHLSQGYVLSAWFVTVTLTLTTGLKWCLSGFSPPPFRIVTPLGERSLHSTCLICGDLYTQ